jgi:SAM-dependent methyltransferase
MTGDTLKYYNENSKNYFETTKSIVISEHIERFLSFVNNKGELIIDLGCGSGNSLKYIIEKEYTAIGADYSDELMALAKQYSGADIFNLDLEDIFAVNKMISDKKIKHLFASASLLHLKKNAFIKFFDKIEFGGVFFFSVKEGIGESLDPAGRFFAYYTKEELDGILHKRFETLYFDRNEDKLGRGNNWLSYIVKLK